MLVLEELKFMYKQISSVIVLKTLRVDTMRYDDLDTKPICMT